MAGNNEANVTLGKALQQQRAQDREPVAISKDDDPAHSDLALQVLADIYSPDTSVRPVFCGGQWWCYKQAQGVWVKADKAIAKRAVLDLRHFVEWQKADGTSRPARLTTAKVDAVYRMMVLEAQDDEFFELAPNSISFKNNTTVVFSPDFSKVKEHSAGWRCRSFYDFEFSLQTGAPKWEAFLASVFEGDEDAAEKQELLREFVGACLRGEATHYEKVLLLLGTGRNGKSIFCDVIAELFQHSMCAIPPQDLSDQHHLVALEPAQLNLVSDIPVRGFRDSGGFKQVVSGDPVTARRLYADHYVFRPRAGHIFSANDLPKSPDTSAGFYRRWVVVSFNRTFTAEDSVPREQLLKSLKAELPGITVWALQGARTLRKRGGFLEPSSSGFVIEEWSADNNQVQQFTLDACTHVPDGQNWTTVQDLYSRYKDWAQENGHAKMSAASFRQRIDKLGYRKRKQKGTGLREYNVMVKPKSAWFGGHDRGEEENDDLLR